MSEIFADSFYFIALLNPKDAHHTPAVGISRSLTHPLVTTHWVLMELADAMSEPALRFQTARFLRSIGQQSKLSVIESIAPWYPRGLTLYERRSDKEWSLTDCISFEVMRDRGITEALTGDHHFTQAGFVALLATP